LCASDLQILEISDNAIVECTYELFVKVVNKSNSHSTLRDDMNKQLQMDWSAHAAE
jgi:hypothetical protein